ncbi:MAG: hypothetical protein FWD86_04015, partial [Firmicutes bacterium]|nr:hypothetical protein [Bacillota bacterium]
MLILSDDKLAKIKRSQLKKEKKKKTKVKKENLKTLDVQKGGKGGSFSDSNSPDNKGLVRNVLLLGFVSFFIDMSSEMVYPFIPIILFSLGAAPLVIGFIEGIAEASAAFLRTIVGRLIDKKTKIIKPLAAVGYSTAIAYKIGLILSGGWLGILFS